MLKAIPIENGKKITEGQLPDGLYYCYAQYSDFDQVKGTVIQIEYEDNSKPSLIKLIATEDPENYLAFPESAKDPETTYPIVSCKDNILTYTGQYWSAPQQSDHSDTGTDIDGFELPIDDAPEVVLGDFPIII